MVQLFVFVALVVALLGQAQPAAAAPEVVKYTLTGGAQFPGPGFEGFDPLTSPGGPIASGSLTVTLDAAGCSTPPVAGAGVCLRNFSFLTTQGQSFGVANRVLETLPALSFATGNGPSSVAVADLDADTAPDLVTANANSDTVSVLLGNGDGTFQAAVSLAAGDNPASVAAADLDADTIPDLVTANIDSDDVSVLLGNGDGTFQAAVSFAAGNGPSAVAVADLDADTIPDLVTANSASDDVSVLLGNGDGTFQAAVSFAAGNGPRFVAVADLDADTIPDLVAANTDSDDVSVLLGNGEGTFRYTPKDVRGPGLAMNLWARGDYTFFVYPYVYYSHIFLDIRAVEAGLLRPIGTRGPFFYRHGSTYFAPFSTFVGSFSSGTFIVGKEVLTGAPVPTLPSGTRAILLLGLGLSSWYVLERRWAA